MFEDKTFQLIWCQGTAYTYAADSNPLKFALLFYKEVVVYHLKNSAFKRNTWSS